MFRVKGANFRFIAVDPGYDRCGYMLGSVVSSAFDVLDYGYITTNASQPIPIRLLELGRDFKTLLVNFKPNYLFIEKVFFTVNKKTGLNIAKVIGVLEFLAANRKIKILELSPNSIKKTVTGQGRASKHQVEYMVRQLFKEEFNFSVDDVADAFAVGYAGMVELLRT